MLFFLLNLPKWTFFQKLLWLHILVDSVMSQLNSLLAIVALFWRWHLIATQPLVRQIKEALFVFCLTFWLWIATVAAPPKEIMWLCILKTSHHFTVNRCHYSVVLYVSFGRRHFDRRPCMDRGKYLLRKTPIYMLAWPARISSWTVNGVWL